MAMRHFAIAALVLLLAGCATTSRLTRGPQAPERFEVDPALLEVLDRIHGELRNEIVFCLVGKTSGGVLHVTRLGATHILTDASPDSIRYDLCDPVEYVGVYHNHPNDTCGLSGMDLGSARNAYHQIDLVSCGNGSFAFWLPERTGVIRGVGAHGGDP
jgi:hypothetical protein